MGGHDSQKLWPRKGVAILSGAQQTSGSFAKINTLAQRPSVPGGSSARATATIEETRKFGLNCGVDSG